MQSVVETVLLMVHDASQFVEHPPLSTTVSNDWSVRIDTFTMFAITSRLCDVKVKCKKWCQ